VLLSRGFECLARKIVFGGGGGRGGGQQRKKQEEESYKAAAAASATNGFEIRDLRTSTFYRAFRGIKELIECLIYKNDRAL
jgi:hypothetical protein